MRPRILPLLLTLLLLLCACGSEEPPSSVYEVERGGRTYTVDQDNQTITCDGETYRFSIQGGGSRISTEITYPDGSTYWWETSEMGGFGGWSDDYDPTAYVDGEVLLEVLGTDRAAPEKDGGNPLPGLLIIGLGIWGVAAPRSVWYLSYGWRYKDAEPSDMALVAERLGGGVAIVVGVILLFV